MMLLMLRLGTARMKLQPPLQLLLLRRRRLPPMHPPRTQPPLQGTDSWRREQPRRPFVGSGAAAAAGQCRCGDRRCCVLRTGRGACAVGLESRCVRPLPTRAGAPTGACAALGVTHREVRRVYLSTLQRCGCIYASVFGCACLAYLPPFVLRLVLPGVTIFCFGCRCVLAPCRLPVHSLRRPRADVHLLPPPRHLWGEASVRFYFLFLLFLVCVRSYVFGADCVCACVLVSLRRGVAAQPCLDPTPPLSLSVCVCVYAVRLPVSLPPMLRALVVPARCRPDRRVYTASNKRIPQRPK
ncbi:hypothetical protein ECC02_008187 [Trypanosoma cruzi]|uniref:Uncharacterized protein n=1 Tax=Trypanosoma cruzi TaxID=5693 RepID=A0A7J6XWJ6_TRYCR|nr:hypothetical protein ECC02_008187 [Trypanosoma cruzi]